MMSRSSMRIAGLKIITVGVAIATVYTNAFIKADEPISETDAEFFESKIRPLLVARCQECHGAEKPKSGFRIDSRSAILMGGESGPAAVLGKPSESLLIDVVGYRGNIQMPPKAKLPDSEIALLTDWVKRGIPWPNSPLSPSHPEDHKLANPTFSDDQKSYWSFQSIRSPEIPRVKNEAWPVSPIDSFVLSKLESSDMVPVSPTERRTLIRRLTLDLIGLPPTPEEVIDFIHDQSPDSIEKLTDRLLASPRYGERWARHWLDVARYADSNGLDENLAYANAYYYRDYVVRSFQNDVPYDQFLKEQIAGDLIDRKSHVDRVQPDDGMNLDRPLSIDQFDQITATGFLSLGAKMLAEDDPVKMQMDIIDEQVDTLARCVMGLTLGCARCHDHKFDPVTMDDYYALAGIFKSTKTMENFNVVARWQERPLATVEQIQNRDNLLKRVEEQKGIVEQLKTKSTDEILNPARDNAGLYLLAATIERQKKSFLEAATPQGEL
ncbi:MAG: DUF1549 domain-containing protein, partial [Planctomycetes bacterium]|nr:DUF1549 domain-containing protein [Planctomycetota bacterium]